MSGRLPRGEEKRTKRRHSPERGTVKIEERGLVGGVRAGFVCLFA